MDPFKKEIFVPKVGEYLTIVLPAETIRSMVVRVPDMDSAIVEIVVAPMGKNHRYRKGDMLPVRRVQNALGEAWVAVDERQLQMAAQMKVFEADQKRKEEEARLQAELEASARVEVLVSEPDEVEESVSEKPVKRKKSA